ncbi:MAG: ABC transporter ATP-binding protein [Acidimicrobiia bacterium]|nr:ABC transporter ATP-binding protein [Acidimicrobiia bacterium]
MAANVVETTGLTKHFGEVRAVQDLSLQVPKGTVFGLLGPNGAGKTTIIGTLLGLIRPTAGTIRLFGTEIDGSTDQAVRRIGAIMETPAFYPYLSGRDNLRYFQGIAGGDDRQEIDHLLDLVGLADRAAARFNTYSLGMKHRLGLAYALLGDPELLLLDEPTNGLDPSGMAEVRQLLRELGDGDRTVVLASHLLNEVEQVCDRVAILSTGRVIAEGEVSDLIGRRDRLRLATTDDAVARRVLAELEWVGSVVDGGGGALLVDAAPDRAGELSEALARVAVYPTELQTVTTSLEQYFLEVTEGGGP